MAVNTPEKSQGYALGILFGYYIIAHALFFFNLELVKNNLWIIPAWYLSFLSLMIVFMILSALNSE